MKLCGAVRAIVAMSVVASLGLFSGCGGGTMSPQKTTPQLRQIVITPANPPITRGATLQLRATGMFDDGVERPLDGPPRWLTSQESIATVDDQGNVKGISEGVADVSAIYHAIISTTSVTVGPPALLSIVITSSRASLPVGQWTQLGATGNFSDGTVQDLTQSVTWTSSEPAITVTTSGKAVAAATGVATISATSGSITGTVNLTVTPAVVIALNVVPASLSLSLGNSGQLTATAMLSDGTSQDVTGSVTWSASPSTVVTANAQGNITGVGKGTALVSASYQGATASAAVSVGPPALTGITIAMDQASLPVGGSEQLTASGKYSDGSAQDLTQSATWNSTSPAIASVSATGSVTAKAAGTATISVTSDSTSNSMTASVSLTVTAPVVTALKIVPGTVSLLLGGSIQLQAIATLSNGTTQDMTATATWSAMPPNVASVTASGILTATRIGSATILAQASGATGSADLTVTPLALVSYFNHAGAVATGIDGTVQLANPGFGDLCAMVYVFDQNEELNECCGCTISDSGLRTLSVLNDLTANPLTGVMPRGGEIKVVPADLSQNPQCNPSSAAPTGALVGWAANAQGSGDNVQVTETPLEATRLTSNEATFLANMCNYLQKLGSGKGICSCGTGD